MLCWYLLYSKFILSKVCARWNFTCVIFKITANIFLLHTLKYSTRPTVGQFCQWGFSLDMESESAELSIVYGSGREEKGEGAAALLFLSSTSIGLEFSGRKSVSIDTVWTYRSLCVFVCVFVCFCTVGSHQPRLEVRVMAFNRLCSSFFFLYLLSVSVLGQRYRINPPLQRRQQQHFNADSFSPTCLLGEEGELLCDGCQSGYTGPRCDRCCSYKVH